MMARGAALGLTVLLIAATPGRAEGQILSNCPAEAVGFTHQGTSADGRTFYDVHLLCGDTEVWAKELAVPAEGDLVFATGDVLFRQPGLMVYAERAEINRQTKLGVFERAYGSARITDAPVTRSPMGTLEPDVTFNVERLEKTGPRTYRLTNGTFTTCQQPTARWDLHGTSGTITLDERVFLRNPVLRVKGVPLLYLPFLWYPIGEDDRSTGLLVPKYQSSSIGGAGIGNAFFWAINRSQDATFYHDWFAKSGQRYGGEYRYVAAPGSEGNVFFTLFDQKAIFGTGNAVVTPAARTTELRGNLSQALPRGFRLTARADYSSNLATRQLFQQNFYDFSSRQRFYGASISGSVGRLLRLSANVDQRDVFYGTTQAYRRGSAPRVAVSFSDTPIGRAYVGATTEVQYVVDQENLNDPTTNRNFAKFNVSPSIRLPVSSLTFLRLTTSAQWQFTRWFESQDPVTGAQVATPVNRSILRLQTSLQGPVVERVWNIADGKYADRIKHLIEPNVTFAWTSPFAGFDRVPRADNDRQVGGTTQITYGLSNRVLARRPAPEGGRGVSRDVVRVEMTQSYYTNPQAALFDQQYSSARSAGSFSPLRVAVEASPADRWSASFSTEIDPKFRTPRTFSSSGRYGSDTFDWQASWTKQQFIPGLPGFNDERFATHTLGASTRVRLLENRVGGAYAFNYDVRNSLLVRQSLSGYYNAQCCGITVDYQVVDRGFAQLPSDRVFSFSFTLAGIGSFANPLSAFGDNRR